MSDVRQKSGRLTEIARENISVQVFKILQVAGAHHRCKNVFKRFILLWSRFYVFNVFLSSKRFFIFKKRRQSSERQAD